MLKKEMGKSNARELAITGMQAGTIGITLLGIVYTGMSVLGMFHGHGLEWANEGELFREIAFKVVGTHGAFIIGTAVLMACLSTSIALSAVLAEYIQKELFGNRIDYIPALTLGLAASLPLSIAGLSKVLELTGGPIVWIGYPVVIALTFCNIAYKLVGFKPVKTPVALTFVVAFASYYWSAFTPYIGM